MTEVAEGRRSWWLLAAAVTLSAIAWAAMLIGIGAGTRGPVFWLLACGLPGVASQVLGLVGTTRATHPLIDLAWIVGVVPALPLVAIATFTLLPVPGL